MKRILLAASAVLLLTMVSGAGTWPVVDYSNNAAVYVPLTPLTAPEAASKGYVDANGGGSSNSWHLNGDNAPTATMNGGGRGYTNMAVLSSGTATTGYRFQLNSGAFYNDGGPWSFYNGGIDLYDGNINFMGHRGTNSLEPVLTNDLATLYTVRSATNALDAIIRGQTNLFAGSGTTGLVTSAPGDAGGYLKADGTWAAPTFNTNGLGLALTNWVLGLGYVTETITNGLATTNWVTQTYYPRSNPSNYLTAYTETDPLALHINGDNTMMAPFNAGGYGVSNVLYLKGSLSGASSNWIYGSWMIDGLNAESWLRFKGQDAVTGAYVKVESDPDSWHLNGDNAPTATMNGGGQYFTNVTGVGRFSGDPNKGAYVLFSADNTAYLQGRWDVGYSTNLVLTTNTPSVGWSIFYNGGQWYAAAPISTNGLDSIAGRDAATNALDAIIRGQTNTWIAARDFAPTNSGQNYYRSPVFPQNATVRGVQGYVDPGGTAVVQVAWQNGTNAPSNLGGTITNLTFTGGYSSTLFNFFTATNGNRLIANLTNAAGCTTNYFELDVLFTTP